MSKVFETTSMFILKALQIINDNQSLSEKGQFVEDILHLVNFNVAMMLWHAKKIGVLEEFIPLAVIINNGVDGGNHSVKKELSSDFFHTFFAIREIRDTFFNEKQKGVSLTSAEISEIFQHHQIRANHYKKVIKDVSVMKIFFNIKEKRFLDFDEEKARQCIFAGSFFNNLFEGCSSLRSDEFIRKAHWSRVSKEFPLNTCSIVSLTTRTGSVIELQSQITGFTAQDVIEVAKHYPDILVVSQFFYEDPMLNFDVKCFIYSEFFPLIAIEEKKDLSDKQVAKGLRLLKELNQIQNLFHRTNYSAINLAIETKGEEDLKERGLIWYFWEQDQGISDRGDYNDLENLRKIAKEIQKKEQKKQKEIQENPRAFLAKKWGAKIS